MRFPRQPARESESEVNDGHEDADEMHDGVDDSGVRGFLVMAVLTRDEGVEMKVMNDC